MALALVLALAAALLPAAPVGAQGTSGDKAAELEEIRARIEGHRARARDLARDERQRLARVHEIEKQAAAVEELVGALEEQGGLLQARIDSLQAMADSSRAVIGERQEALGQSLRAMYKRGRKPALAVLAGARDLQGMATRLRWMTRVARSERSLIDEVQHAALALRGQQGELRERLAQLQENQAEAAQQRAQLTSLRDEGRVELAQIRRRREHFESSVAQLQKAATALEQLLDDLQRRAEGGAPVPAPSGNFAMDRGRLPWPVQGRLTRGFGRSIHPQFKTEVMNKGWHLAARDGTPIQVVADGVVEYVEWLPGYGKCTIVRHGDGFYTLYAHASATFCEVGQAVRAGEVIAEVGDTGSLDGSQLYFEVRKGRDPLDPGEWLAPRRRR